MRTTIQRAAASTSGRGTGTGTTYHPLVLLLCLLLSGPSHGGGGSGGPFLPSHRRPHLQARTQLPRRRQQQRSPLFVRTVTVRGGSSSGDDGGGGEPVIVEEEVSLEDKVAAAMARLGLTPEGLDDEDDGGGVDDTGAAGGDAIAVDEDSSPNSVDATDPESYSTDIPPPPPINEAEEEEEETKEPEDIETTIRRISTEMDIDESIVTAALGATLDAGDENNGDGSINEGAARRMIQGEIDAIQSVPEDCDEVQTLLSEGHDPSLARRALAFADRDLPFARTILAADEEDAQTERDQRDAARAEASATAAAAKRQREAEERGRLERSMGSVRVEQGFDPTRARAPAPVPVPVAAPAAAPAGPPPARVEDVVFSASSANIAELVLESPVPVLLDVYADWCGPCKALTPALSEMAVRGGGLFRLVTLDTDAERTLTTALEVKSLPTVFAVREGRIIDKFEGMPKSEDFVKRFMTGLMTGTVEGGDAETEEKLRVLSGNFVKAAGAAGFSFEEREKLVARTVGRLDLLVTRGDMATAGGSARVLSSLLSNVANDPFEQKFKRINLENRVIAAKVAAYPPAVAILKSVGFGRTDGTPRGTLLLGAGTNTMNVAPLAAVRDTVDQWVNKNAREIAAAERKKRDAEAREALLANAEEEESSDDGDTTDAAPVLDPDVCLLKLRIEGKKKRHDVALRAGDPLGAVLTAVPGVVVPEGGVARITCAARRLSVRSSDVGEMGKSLREHGLTPASSVVIQIGERKREPEPEPGTAGGGEGGKSGGSLQERAAARKSKKMGEHTMQSVGIYSKDDNAKGELIDGGGGTWYEQDITDDEEEKEEETAEDGDKSPTKEESGVENDSTADDGGAD